MRDSFGRFVKGNVPWITGTKGMIGKNSGSFKKGLKPWNKGISTVYAGKKWLESIRPDIKGKKNYKWNGGSSIHSNGYRYLAMSNIESDIYIKYFKGVYGSRRIPEHQYIWIKHHKKSIPKKFHVHHINGIKSDNRIENLVVINGGEHSRLHLKGKKKLH